MSVVASDLTNVTKQIRTALTIARAHLKTLDDSIREQNEIGKRVLLAGLPTEFGIDGMNDRDAQREIYTYVIQDLEKRGFTVAIDIAASTKLYIKWNNAQEESRVAAQLKYLASHKVPRDTQP
jgi:hypothetical protein